MIFFFHLPQAPSGAAPLKKIKKTCILALLFRQTIRRRSQITLCGRIELTHLKTNTDTRPQTQTQTQIQMQTQTQNANPKITQRS